MCKSGIDNWKGEQFSFHFYGHSFPFLNFLIKWMNTTASIWPDEMVAEKLNIIFVGYVVTFCFNFMNWWLMKL